MKIIDEKHWLLIINTGKEVDKEKIKQNSYEGFPTRFRSSIWMYLATQSENYRKFRVEDFLKEEIPQKTIIQIEKDVMRTSPPSLFRKSLKMPLTRILQAYSRYDKQLGYTQGMNFVASIIILVLIGYGRKDDPNIENKKLDETEIENKTFCIFRYLMEDKGIRKLMIISPELLTDLYLRIDEKIKELSPKMWEVIQSTGFTC